MLSKTHEYALRVMIELAKCHSEQPVTGARLASRSGVPAKYLSKILGDLVRARLLEATPGRGGGFFFSRSPESIRLSDVVSLFDCPQVGPRKCPFFNQRCSDHKPCPRHEAWSALRADFQKFWRDTLLSQFASDKVSK